ncbi:MAG: cytochrome c1, partial [Pseudomonadota bacterium]
AAPAGDGLPEFEVLQAGSLSPEEYDALVTDLVTFIQYAGEPAALKRASMGVWVLLYLSLFTFLAWIMKKEYWRDIKGH